MHTQISARQQALRRKFYMALPALVLPFITALYWLWIVRPAADYQPTEQVQGLLTSVPDAMLGSDKQLNKLSFYKQAEADSAKLQGQIRKDPYLDQVQAGVDSFQAGQLAGLQGPFGRKGAFTAARSQPQRGASENERKVYEKLRELDQVLSQASAPDFEQVPAELPAVKEEAATGVTGQGGQSPRGYPEQTTPTDPDPEIEQLNGVLDKILAIQDPASQAVPGTALVTKPERKVLTVSASVDSGQVDILAAGTRGDSAAASAAGEGGFFSLEEPVGLPLGNAISAEVDQDQTLVSGQVLRIRLTQDVFIGGSKVPVGSLLYGKVSINNQRLMAEIESIQFENAVLPVRLSVYDLDGIAGIHIPDDVARQVAKQSLSQDIQGVDIGVLDPSLAGQAVGAGIQTAKSLLSRKARLIQITVHEGYRVLLLGKQAAL